MGGIVYYEVVLARFLLHCNPKYVMCAKLYKGLYELFLTDFWWGLYKEDGHDLFSFLTGGNIPFFLFPTYLSFIHKFESKQLACECFA